MNMVPDYHIHTVLCKHASGTPSEYRDTAVARGLPEMCFTDHCPNPDGIGIADNMEMDQFPEYVDMIAPLMGQGALDVMLGVEADYYPGCQRNLSAWLPDKNLDLVLGSIHFMDGWGIDNPLEMSTWESADVPAAWTSYFGMIADMARTRLFDIVGHLDLPKKFGFRPSDECVAEIAKPMLDAIAEAGMAIEISTGGLRKPVAEIYPSPQLLTLACERNIAITFGSDAHAPEEVGADFDKSIALARDVGYSDYVRFRKREQMRVSLPEPD